MRLIERLRLRRQRRRAGRAERLDEQAKLRRDLESVDRGLAEATRVQPPPGSPFGSPF